MKATKQESISSPQPGLRARVAIHHVANLRARDHGARDAHAKPANALAREHLATGNRNYRLREFEKALEEAKAGAVREDGFA